MNPEIAETNTSFFNWEALTTFWVIAFFVLIIICDLYKVFMSFSTWEALSNVSCIDSSSRSGILKLSFSITLLPFLFLFPSLFRVFFIFEALENGSFWFQGPGFTFFNSWVFYWLGLSTGVGSCWPSTTEKVLIGHVSERVKHKRGFELGVDCFFNDLFKAIKLLAKLFHLGSYWEL